ncbi:MAG: leucine-rich repeat domain-containing protein, partial [Muribaculum sp.]|nr:leucine-rich repeat domain-containing protein [Muribaculum sp.]
MKRTLLHNVEQLRYFAMLLIVAWCGTGIAAALESDDINAKILSASSTVIPKWTDDATNPWVFNNDSTEISAPSYVDTNITSTVTMTISSQYDMYFNVDVRTDYYNNSTFYIKVDSIESKINDYSNRWTTIGRNIPAGEHKIEFIANFTDENSEAAIQNVAIKEFKPLETACLKEGSMPLTFENDSIHPWLTEDGYIRSMTAGLKESTSTISTTFSVDKPSLFCYSMNHKFHNGSYSSNYSRVRINGISFESRNSNTYDDQYKRDNSVLLYPGTYTIEFENYHNNDGINTNNYTELSNVRLTQDWLQATMSQPGELNVRVLQALGDKNLQDADILKISGSLNDNDWATIKQLTGIVAIDLSETNITSVPANAFSTNSHLSTVMLPETVTEIGASAFVGTNFHKITIPSSVEVIGSSAWENTPLRYINFAEGSKLTIINGLAFAGTKIMEFEMPDSVTSVSTSYSKWNTDSDYASSYSSPFKSCSSLTKLHLSDGLRYVPYVIAYNCTALKEVNIPKNATDIRDFAFYNASLDSINIPETVTEIGEYAFYNNNLTKLDIPESITSINTGAFRSNPFETLTISKNVTSLGASAFSRCSMKELVLNSHCWNMNSTFSGCTSLETVVIPCATPPSISSDPFSGVTKSQVKLIVPDFALMTYRSDNYWYNFTNIVAGDEASLNDYWAIRGNLSLDSSRSMQGTPSVEIMAGGTMTLDTDMTQGFNDFTYNTSETSPAAFLSKSNNVTANNLTTSFSAAADKWYFFSPVADVNMADVTYSSTDSWVIRYYDGERRGVQNDNSGNWINMPADGVLKRGQGYIFQAASSGTLNMPAATDKHEQFFGSNEVNFELADNASESEANAGWNFVSNPYPCYYDIYYIAMQAPITVWNGSTYRAYSLNDGDRGDDTFVLRPM